MANLKTADAVQAGALAASKVYQGSNLVWEADAGPPPGGTPVAENTAEGGADGVTVSSANSGGASGIAWNNVTVTGVMAYSAADAIKGGMAIRMESAGACSLVWRTQIGLLNPSTGRLYFTPLAYPGYTAQIVLTQVDPGGGDACYRVCWEGSGLLRFRNAGATSIGTTTAGMAIGVQYRIEWEVDHTTGDWWTAFYEGDSLTPVDEISGNDSTLGAQAGMVTFGRSQAPEYSAVFDDIAMGTERLGPS